METSLKTNLRPFKLHRVYLEPLNSSNVRDFSWSWILKGFYPCSNREGKICRSMSTPSTKRRIGRFHVVVLKWTSKKRTKKCDARAEQLFCSENQSLLKVLNSAWAARVSARCICIDAGHVSENALYSRTFTNGHLSTTVTSLQRSPPYNGHLSTTVTSLKWPPLYNGHLSTTATSLQRSPL